MRIYKIQILASLMTLCLMACNSKPRVIEAEVSKQELVPINPSSSSSSKIVPTLTSTPVQNKEEHEVVVKEILDTDKYSYLKVIENDEPYWVAISKREVTVGKTYIYRGGLKKRNFFSREFDRTFETVYLVSQFKEKQSTSEMAKATPTIKAAEALPDLEVGEIELAEGAIPLSDLFLTKTGFSEMTIKVTGKVVKVNPKIMNRNWLHIQDGSGDGLDLTVTTSENVPLGAVVSLEGKIAVNKDFGAGYRYDIIMEDAVLK